MLQAAAGLKSLHGLSHMPLAATQLLSLQQATYAKAAAKPSKAATPTKAGKKTKELGTNDNKFQKFLLALAPQEIADLDLSTEQKADAAARSKEYSRRKMAQHRYSLPRAIQHGIGKYCMTG